VAQLLAGIIRHGKDSQGGVSAVQLCDSGHSGLVRPAAARAWARSARSGMAGPAPTAKAASGPTPTMPATPTPGTSLPPPPPLPQGLHHSALAEPTPTTPYSDADLWEAEGLLCQQAFSQAEFRVTSDCARKQAHLAEGGIDLLEHAMFTLTQGHYQDMSEANFKGAMEAVLLNSVDFSAGYISERLPVWEAYFKRFGGGSKTQEVSALLREGVKIRWVPAFSPCQQAHPRYEKRLERVRAMLSQTVGPQRVEAMLAGEGPQEVRFKKRMSVEQNLEFVSNQLQEYLQQGVLQEHKGGI